MTEPLLEIRALAAGYGQVPVLSDVALVINPGEIVTLVGSNGAGKTTLLRALSRVIQARGTVRFGGPGTVLGPVVGAFVLSAVSEVLASKATSVASLFYGFVIVAAVVLMPKGILDLMEGFRTSRWRYFTDNVRRYRL